MIEHNWQYCEEPFCFETILKHKRSKIYHHLRSFVEE